ncbi:hypothetical protein NP493_1651g00016 [Ridgeia piscesae]|uniref:Uncharacterized protein n=1 Tax=Ridgeia piscesae TaxID=27915 RepID=A0AAD9JWH0_RIDPI|nr:hypothetical protein NP493_1651g00016 [Ridgeia piscesae]
MTFELNILSFVLILICFTLQRFLNLMNATVTFFIIALTSSFVPPFFIVLTRYVNESIFRWLSFQCNGDVVRCVGFHNLCLAYVEIES